MHNKTITIMILTICVGISFAAENGGDDIVYELKKNSVKCRQRLWLNMAKRVVVGRIFYVAAEKQSETE